jgi:chorismate mutase-like protein
MDPFDDLRRRIDALDVQLVALLSERARCALEIGRLKEARGLKVYQPDREIQVLANVRAANEGPLNHEAIVRLFERIIDVARRLERQDSATGPAGAGTSGTVESDE